MLRPQFYQHIRPSLQTALRVLLLRLRNWSTAPLPLCIIVPCPASPETRVRSTILLRAVIEITFIIFLFYSNLLMGEFNASNRPGKTLAIALHDIFTPANFAIAMVAATIGYIVFEYLRKKL